MQFNVEKELLKYETYHLKCCQKSHTHQNLNRHF